MMPDVETHIIFLLIAGITEEGSSSRQCTHLNISSLVSAVFCMVVMAHFALFRSRAEIVVNHMHLFRERHSEEYCAMYDICGARSDGKVLNCPYGSPSVKVF